jgi:hypothetical protein
MLDSHSSSPPVADIAPRARRRARRRERSRSASPPFARLGVVLVVSGLLGLLALAGGWALGAAVWGDDGDTAFLPVVAVVLPGGAGFAPGFAEPVARAQVGPTAVPTPQLPPPPSPVLAGRRLVTYYGNPLADVLGVLGEGPPERMIARLRQQATAYEADGRPVQPALHLIATVAQAAAGDDGMYRMRMPPEMLDTWSKLADDNGLLLILDVQVGRSSVQEEVEVLRPWLTQSHVHLALDPEFDMSPTTLPGRQLGTMDADDINWAIGYLAEIAATYRLENRVLIVHQFDESMIRNKDTIIPNLRVDLAVCMDGYGSPALKISQYNRYVAEQPIEYASIKLFYKHDRPLMTPREVLALDPVPDVVIYQ